MNKSKKGKKRFGRNSKDFQQRPSTPAPKKSILVVVEGDTEKLYFEKFKHYLRLQLVDVKVANPDCTDPVNLVNKAIELKLEKEREAKRKKDTIKDVLEYDEVWVVYDLEKPHDERRTLSTTAKNKKETKQHAIKFAISDPCFEFWYILHFERTTKSFTGANEVEKYLKNVIFPKYTKKPPFEPTQEIIDKTQTAIENAQWVRRQLEDSQSVAPRTDVDLLVKELK